MPAVTFTITGTLLDFGNNPRVGVKVQAAPISSVKVGDDAVFGTEPESAITDENGEFTLELVSLPGLWYRITAKGINTVRLAAYTPDLGDPTTGVVFAPGVIIELEDIVDEDPTPGYEGLMLADIGPHIADTTDVHGIADTADLIVEGDPRLTDARPPTAHIHDDRYYTEAEVDALIPDVSGLATDAELAAEAAARLAADNALDGRVDTLEAAPPVDLSGLATDAELLAEAAARAGADTALDVRVDALEGAPPPDLSGYATDAELAAEAATRSGADAALDTRVDALESAPPGYTDEMARDALGAALVGGTNVTVTVDDGSDTITIAASGATTAAGISDFTEASQDVIGSMVTAAGGSYDDGAGTITLPGGTSTEDVQDIIGAMIAAAGGSYDDGAGSIAFPSTHVESTTVNLIVSLTQAAYDALGTPDAATLYVIVP